MKVCVGMYGCGKEKDGSEFYNIDSTCKDCRKAAVNRNRNDKAEYYREYDRNRFQADPRVIARHKRYQATPAGKASIKKSHDKWASNNAIKKGASTIVGNAVRNGRMFKPDDCCECGDSPTMLHGHHDDYAFPLTVRWLCSKCHNSWHKINGSGLNG